MAKSHTITISYAAGTIPPWSYTIVPNQADPKKAKIKRGDDLNWVSQQGAWTVFFKGTTPLVDSAGIGIASLGAAGGVSAGGTVSKKPKVGATFTYGVSLLLPGTTGPVTDDPEIIIESDGAVKKKKKAPAKPKSKPKARAKPKPKKKK